MKPVRIIYNIMKDRTPTRFAPLTLLSVLGGTLTQVCIFVVKLFATLLACNIYQKSMTFDAMKSDWHRYINPSLYFLISFTAFYFVELYFAYIYKYSDNTSVPKTAVGESNLVKLFDEGISLSNIFDPAAFVVFWIVVIAASLGILFQRRPHLGRYAYNTILFTIANYLALATIMPVFDYVISGRSTNRQTFWYGPDPLIFLYPILLIGARVPYHRILFRRCCKIYGSYIGSFALGLSLVTCCYVVLNAHEFVLSDIRPSKLLSGNLLHVSGSPEIECSFLYDRQQAGSIKKDRLHVFVYNLDDSDIYFNLDDVENIGSIAFPSFNINLNELVSSYQYLINGTVRDDVSVGLIPSGGSFAFVLTFAKELSLPRVSVPEGQHLTLKIKTNRLFNRWDRSECSGEIRPW